MFRRRIFTYLALFVVLGLLLTACERPLSGSRPSDEADQTTETQGTEAEPVQSTEEEAQEPPEAVAEEPQAEEATEEEVADESPRVEEAAEEEAAEETAEPAEATEEESQEAEETAEEPAEAAEEAAETEEAAEEGQAAEEPAQEEQAAEESAEAIPATHTVVAGENLYRIGLQYGVSWVTIAQLNNLPNANYVFAGQVLQLPGGQLPETGDGDMTSYVVRPGDNLYRIGLAFGVGWVQIAEANGIVNPNHIFAGQELKIPSSAPGPSPQFTHVVQPGEFLVQIALRYGVNWLAIAQENGIGSPYVIFPGQTLVIPGG